MHQKRVNVHHFSDFHSVSDLRKDQIVALLDEQLISNASTHSNNPSFEGYYARRGSPMKRELGSTPAAEAELTRSVTRRRAPRIKGESSV